MLVEISIQKIAKLITVYLFVFLLGLGLFFTKQANDDTFKEWVVVADGTITNKKVVNEQPYFVINDKQVLVDASTYQKFKVNDKTSLGHLEDKMPAWKVILALLSCLATLIVGAVISINFLIWLYCHSDSESYFEYFKESFLE